MRTIKIGDADLEYLFIGPDPNLAPTIVMLHEGLGSVSIWKNFPQQLMEATNAGVAVYSRAGYGKSSLAKLPRPVDYLHREALDVLPEFLDAIGFKRGILLGHSDGGSIAAIYCGSVQDHRIRGLALIEPHFMVEPINLATIRQITSDYRTTNLRDLLQRHHADVDHTFRGWSEAWLDPRFEALSLREELSYIRVPILIVKGENDPYSTVEQIRVAEEECYCPVESVIIKSAGHAPHRDQPKETLETIASFINRLLWSHDEGRIPCLVETAMSPALR